MQPQTRWKLPKENLKSSSQLAKKTNLSLIASQILVNRGITSPKDVESFLNPPEYLPSSCSYIPNLKEASDLIMKNIKNNNKILVFGDFDVDGITGTTLLYEVLTLLGGNVSYYVPHRFTEGYGLNKNAIDKYKKDGISLIVTVDCGIGNVEEVAYAAENKIDVIITDHHQLPSILPQATIIINPKLNPENNPGYNLSGVGVAFKLAEEIVLSHKNDIKINLEDYLDLVALGTISDIVPLLDDNRLLTINGLKKLSNTKRQGLKHLCQLARIKYPLGAQEVGFYIGPLLNAPGRLEHASLSVDLLLAKSPNDALNIAQKLNKLNISRQKITQKIREDIENKIKTEVDLSKDKVIFMSSPDWHPGVIGIVASQLAKKYSRPTILISEKEGFTRGSARSISNLNLFKIFSNLSKYLISFGGHAEALGFTIDKNNIPELKHNITLLLNQMLREHELYQLINIDASINASDISLTTAKELTRFAPYGSSNPQPTLACFDINVLDYTLVGNGQHLKATFTDKQGKILLDGIGFNMADYIDTIKKGRVNLAFSIEVNNYNNFDSTQLKLTDIQHNETLSLRDGT